MKQDTLQNIVTTTFRSARDIINDINYPFMDFRRDKNKILININN